MFVLGASQNSIGTARLGQQLLHCCGRCCIDGKEFEEPLSIATLCAQIALSQRQLIDYFNAMSVNRRRYITATCVDRARGFVTQTRMPLSEVALACGFASQVHSAVPTDSDLGWRRAKIVSKAEFRLSSGLANVPTK